MTVDSIPQVRLPELTGTELVRTFNALADRLGSKPVTKFETTKVARRRIGELLAKAFPGTYVGEDGVAFLPRGALFNHETTTFEDVAKETSVENVDQVTVETPAPLPPDTGSAEKPKRERKAKAEGAPKTPAEGATRGGRPNRYGDDARITIKTENGANPKRAGSKAFDRFSIYKDGMTVGEFLKAGGTAADLAWDVKHGFISVAA